jgi:hypothetical protein
MKRPKFGKPLPSDRPGPKEDFEQFAERMAAHGDRKALDRYQAARKAGQTHEGIQQDGYTS